MGASGDTEITGRDILSPTNMFTSVQLKRRFVHAQKGMWTRYL
jgi:hypothetical protein